MAVLAKIGMTTGLFVWLALVISVMAISHSVISDELDGGAGSAVRNTTTGIALASIAACALWVWFSSLAASRQNDERRHSQAQTLGLLFGLTAVFGIITVFVSSMASEEVVSAGLLWLVIPASAGTITISLVLYRTHGAIKYMPVRSIIFTFALLTWLGFVSIAVFAVAGAFSSLSAMGSSVAAIYYSSGIGIGLVIVNICALWVWLPVFMAAGTRQGWLKAHLFTFGAIAVSTALILVPNLILATVVSLDILIFLSPVLLACAFVFLVSCSTWTPLRRLLRCASASVRVDPEPVPWFDPRVAEWIRSFSSNMHTQYYQENRGYDPATDDWFNEWHRRLHPRKLFMPSDFVSTLKIDSAEDFGCVRIWVDRLFLTVQQSWQIIKVRYIGRYLTDINYEPTGFSNETVYIATDRRETTCRQCGGDGTVYCPPTQACGGCGGSGRAGCYRCNGSGYDFDERRTFACGGCYGRGYNPCTGCDNGQVTCSYCGGSGRRTCMGCDGVGYVINALVTTKTFAHHRDVNFQIEGLGNNQFKNGLKPGHFDKLNGSLVREESQTPIGPGSIRQKLTAFAFYVYACHYEYKGQTVTLNQIYPSKYVATNLPYSRKRISLAIALATCLAAGVLALVLTS